MRKVLGILVLSLALCAPLFAAEKKANRKVASSNKKDIIVVDGACGREHAIPVSAHLVAVTPKHGDEKNCQYYYEVSQMSFEESIIRASISGADRDEK